MKCSSDIATTIILTIHVLLLPSVESFSTFRVQASYCDQQHALPSHLVDQVRSIVVNQLWKDQDIPIFHHDGNSIEPRYHGEASYPFPATEYSERLEHFEQLAEEGDPCAQHSSGLLYWSGFAKPKASARGECCDSALRSAQWHGAAALQGHVDALAILGGCLRTGTGVKKNVGLGLSLIDYCAKECGNPTGVNKLAALEESTGNDDVAFQLYQHCHERGSINSLLLMNLGWCHVHGQGTKKDEILGEDFWKRATAMAPDEGSEEAAWMLYLQYEREHPKEALPWLNLAAALGYEDAKAQIQ